MKFNIDENLVFVIILDISGIYAQIYDQGYHNKEDVKDIQKQANALRYSEGKKFFDPLQQDVFPKEDFALCTDVDHFDFAIHAEMHGRIAYNRKEYLHA